VLFRSAALVALPTVGLGALSPVVLAIVIALPVGKLVGITGGVFIASRLGRSPSSQRMPFADVLAVAALGGIGFTVSLLMNELAFERSPDIAAHGTIAVIVASLIAAVFGTTLTFFRARHYRSIAVD
jgi:NhaA family Na+:H+ antiporter